MIHSTILSLWAFTVGVTQDTLAFTHGFSRLPTRTGIKALRSDVDLSIEYDAAAKFAYNQWREEFGKGDFDPDRFKAFKDNYEMLTVTNVIAAKTARNSGGVKKRLVFNKFADFTTEEYKAMQEGKTTTGEGKKDSTEVISTSKMTEKVDLSQPSTVVSIVDLSIEYDAAAKFAYNQWREEYGKGDFNDERYSVFKANYEKWAVANVVSAKRARDSGETRKRLELNEFADLTTEDYKGMNEEKTAAVEGKKDSSEALKESDVDLSIEYDAAAKFAYNQWREEYGKGDFNNERYSVFKANYEACAVANVVSARKAKDSGETRKRLELNEFADLTTEEYKGINEETTTAVEGKKDSSEALKESDVDVSIEYDAAAKFAYNQWREKFGKGDFDPDRFKVFKDNYEMLTVTNIIAAKTARKSGGVKKRMELNEFADLTTEEYKAIKEGKTTAIEGKIETTSENSLGAIETAMEASIAQNTASSAIEEATAALEEEEKILAEKLGLKSIEELEAAIDSLNGIAEDGSEIDDIPTQEARIRSAYIEWCNEYGKEIDESRYPTFLSNYVAMEQNVQESKNKIDLNMYADCTEEEFIALRSDKGGTVVKATKVKGNTEDETKIREEVDIEANAKEDAPLQTDTEIKEAKKVAALNAKEKAALKLRQQREAVKEREEANAAAVEKEFEEAKKKFATMTTKRAETAKAVEEKQKKRRATQEKALSDAAATAEATAIATANELAKKEAARTSKVSKIDRLAKELILEEARQAEEKLAGKSIPSTPKQTQKISSKPSDKTSPKPSPSKKTQRPKPVSVRRKIQVSPATDEKSLFESRPGMKNRFQASSTPEKPSRENLSVEDSLTKFLNPLSLFFGSEPSTKDVRPNRTTKPDVRRQAEKIVTKQNNKPTRGKIQIKKIPPPAPVKPESPVRKESLPTSTTKPVTKKEPFSFFQSKSKKMVTSSSTDKAKVIPTSTTKPVTKKEPFSFFQSKSKKVGTSSSTDKAKVRPTSTTKPVTKKEPFSFFQSKSKKLVTSSSTDKAAARSPRPKGNTALNSTTKPVATRKQSLSFFGKKPKKTAPLPAVKKSVVPAKKKVQSSRMRKEPLGTFKIKTAEYKFGVKTKAAKPVGTKPVAKKKSSSIFDRMKPKKISQNSISEQVDIPDRKRMWGSFNMKATTDKQANSPLLPKPTAKRGAPKKPLGKRALKDDTPLIKNWEQEPDGSITGDISNSKNFREGETITTSPVRGVAKSGRVVVTISGSKYRLM